MAFDSAPRAQGKSYQKVAKTKESRHSLRFLFTSPENCLSKELNNHRQTHREKSIENLSLGVSGPKPFPLAFAIDINILWQIAKIVRSMSRAIEWAADSSRRETIVLTLCVLSSWACADVWGDERGREWQQHNGIRFVMSPPVQSSLRGFVFSLNILIESN
jgi:hypothetical protein